MIESAISALIEIFSWPSFLFVVVGTLVGFIFGAIPGLGGIIAIALLIPLTFGLDGGQALILLGATLGGTAFGGSISAILINVPGTAPNAATLLDGYPLTKQGHAAKAIGAAATASALGALFGLVVLILSIPVAREIVLAFSAPEFFWLAILGLTVIVVIGQGNPVKNTISGMFGLMLTFIGYAGVTGTYRYGFGTDYLWDGIQLIPVIIGLFAVGEVIHLMTKGGTIVEEDVEPNFDRREVFDGMADVVRRPSLLIRCSAIGTIIGMVPGGGGVVSNFVAYMYAMQYSDSPGSFGTGNIEGVIAPEAANDSKDGGGLIPTVVFGIPGSGIMAVLLGAFLLHGLEPGSQMLTEDLDILFMLIFALLISNLLTSTIGVSTSNYLKRITYTPVELFVPAILVVSLIGAFAIRSNFYDVIIALAFGIIGYLMMTFDYSRVIVIIALVLGPLAERTFLQTLQMTQYSDLGYLLFFARPISFVLIVLILLTLFYQYRRDSSTDLTESV